MLLNANTQHSESLMELVHSKWRTGAGMENGPEGSRLTYQVNGDGHVSGYPVKPLGEDSVVDGRHSSTGGTHRKQSDTPTALTTTDLRCLQTCAELHI